MSHNIEKLVVVGDVHGEYSRLQNLLGQIESKYPEHTIVFLGDLNDGGPDSYWCVEAAKQLVDAGRAIVFEGNHGWWARIVVDRSHFSKNDGWLQNGGRECVRSYNERYDEFGLKAFAKQFKESGHYDLFKNAPLYYEDDYVFLSHAPAPKDKYIKNLGMHWRDSRQVLQWLAHYYFQDLQEDEYAREHGKLAVCGHVHMLDREYAKARVYPHIVYLDSGCGCSDDAPLSAAVIERGQLVEILES